MSTISRLSNVEARSSLELVLNGWYKITDGNNVFVREFVDGYTGHGWRREDWGEWVIFEPVDVTPRQAHASGKAA